MILTLPRPVQYYNPLSLVLQAQSQKYLHLSVYGSLPQMLNSFLMYLMNFSVAFGKGWFQ
jgi:hypothetical protein